MNNFPTGSFLSVKLTQTLFVAKVRKKRTMARIDFLLNIYKESNIFFKALIGLNSIIYVCPKNFKLFHKFFAEQQRVKCKKKTLFIEENFLLIYFLLVKIMYG